MTAQSKNTLSTLTISVGTYDGVLAGWEWKNEVSRIEETSTSNDDGKLEIAFASPVHQGSVRDVAMMKGLLLSAGYDESLRIHDFCKRHTSLGEIRTPAGFGTPMAASFSGPSHALVAFSPGGQLVLYRKRDWSIQHVFKGHEGGTASVAVHPSHKLVLSAGVSDGKLKLWDLTKARLAYTSKIKVQERLSVPVAVTAIIWNQEGTAYAFCYGSHLTVRDVASGSDLLDVELPSKIHQLCFLHNEEEGLFLAAACDDGSLPVLLVPAGDKSEELLTEERMAVMAIEPVEGPVAGVERFKCIEAVHSYQVVTANSGGVVSLINLSGAVRMILHDKADILEPRDNNMDSNSENDEEDDSDDDDNDEKELAAEIMDSVQIGSGARITCLAAHYSSVESIENEPVTNKRPQTISKSQEGKNSKRGRIDTIMKPETVDRARKLVAKAKKIQRRKDKKKETKRRS